jgi:hypothetical protein
VVPTGSTDLDNLDPTYFQRLAGAHWRAESGWMSDERLAGDIKITRHMEGQRWTLGLVSSSENDFRSCAASVRAAWWTADQNTGWNMTLGLTRDRIGRRLLVAVTTRDEVEDLGFARGQCRRR